MQTPDFLVAQAGQRVEPSKLVRGREGASRVPVDLVGGAALGDEVTVMRGRPGGQGPSGQNCPRGGLIGAGKEHRPGALSRFLQSI